MTIRAIIPTKNNSHALASLLGSLMRYTNRGTTPVYLSICDASDLPVICQPHIARMLASFRVRYIHTHQGGLIPQRILAIREYREDDLVLSFDDDLVVASGAQHDKAFDEIPLHTSDPVFGIAVDTLNDRCYPDYSRSRDVPGVHWFPRIDATASPLLINDPAVATGQAIAGHVLCRAGQFLAALDAAMQAAPGAPPEVIDDAAATYLARIGSPWVSPYLMCEHIGNSHNHWRGGSLVKHIAVTSVVDKAKNIK